jgi:hypothetical protein
MLLGSIDLICMSLCVENEKKGLYFASQTNKQCILHKSILHNSIAMISLKPYTLAGFEPGTASGTEVPGSNPARVYI